MNTHQPSNLVSIIINNYNYGRYLPKAIDSALTQSYTATEVIVVDDGSSDDSRAVIASYGDRIIPVLKQNGGQASALNTGLAHSHGEIVFFLDADDMLHPTIVEQVVALFLADPETVRVQFRLAVIDASGNELDTTKPPASTTIPSGKMRQSVLLYGDDIGWLPTSGNAFSASMLRRIFPIPEAEYCICADYYLSNISALFGSVKALDHTGGCYRVHGTNNHETKRLDSHQMRQLLVRTDQTHAHLERYAQILGWHVETKTIASLSLTFLANRLISLRLDPRQHPFIDDTPTRLACRAVLAAWRRGDLSIEMRLLYTGWFLAAVVAPPNAARWLAEQLFYPEARGRWFNEFLTSLRHVRPRFKVQP